MPTKKRSATVVSGHKSNTNPRDVLRQRLFLGLAVASLFGGMGYRLVSQGHAAASCRTATLREGSRGVCVRTLQGLIGAPIDGTYSSDTRSRVMVYQTSVSLNNNGAVDPETWTALCYSLNSELRDRTGYAYAVGCNQVTDAYGKTYYQ